LLRFAAEALGAAFETTANGVEVAVRDILDFTPSLFRENYSKGYLRIVRRVPELWGYLYSLSDRKAAVPWRRKVRGTFNRLNTGDLFRYIDEFTPDLVICTHFLPLEVLASRADRRLLETPFFCCITDCTVHALWVVEGVDCYYVGSHEAMRQLIRRGQEPKDVVCTGIPIDPVFERRISMADARVALALDPGLPVLLSLGGGIGIGPAIRILQELEAAAFACQVLCIAGSNEDLRQEAEHLAPTLSSVRLVVHGFVYNIHELLDAADLVIGKPGGLICSEALAKGVPLVMVDPIPGQEQRNCEHLLELGAGVRLLEAADAPDKIQALLGDPVALGKMRERALAAGRPRAARDVVEDILRRIVA